MKITDKIKAKQHDIYSRRPTTIAFLGDSVTQGCFEIYTKTDGTIDTIYKSEEAYHAKVREMLQYLYPSVPFTIINAGISGDTAPGALGRVKEDVLSYNPDLTVVCLGLNDSGKGVDKVNEYIDALDEIFTKIKESGSEIIFMTPNMKGQYAHHLIEDKTIYELAEKMANEEESKCMDFYVDKARELSKKHEIPVCDCYALWKIMHEKGVDITGILSNFINHPTPQMHSLFAYELVKTIITAE